MEFDAKLMFKRIFDMCSGVDVVLCERKCDEILARERVSKYIYLLSKGKETLVAVD